MRREVDCGLPAPFRRSRGGHATRIVLCTTAMGMVPSVVPPYTRSLTLSLDHIQCRHMKKRRERVKETTLSVTHQQCHDASCTPNSRSSA